MLTLAVSIVVGAAASQGVAAEAWPLGDGIAIHQVAHGRHYRGHRRSSYGRSGYGFHSGPRATFHRYRNLHNYYYNYRYGPSGYYSPRYYRPYGYAPYYGGSLGIRGGSFSLHLGF
jgi:hypothetical protein